MDLYPAMTHPFVEYRRAKLFKEPTLTTAQVCLVEEK